MRFSLLLAPLLLALDNSGADNLKQQFDQFQGTWKVTALEVGGHTLAAKDYENDLVTFKKGEMTVVRKGTVVNVYRVKLDPSKEPKQVELLGVTGLDEGKTLRGIYRLEADRLTLCVGPGERARDFVTRIDTTQALTSLKRHKSDGTPAASGR